MPDTTPHNPTRKNPLPVLTIAALALGVVTLLIILTRQNPPAAGTDPAAPAASSKTATAEKLSAILDSAARYAAGNEPGKAEAIYKESIAQFVEERELYLAYARFLATQRRPSDSYSQYEKALALGIRELAIELEAGNIAVLAGKTDRAVEHYSAAQQMDPANAQTPLRLAQVQLKRNDLTAAKASLLRAIKLDDQRALPWGMLAEVAMRENNASIALQHIEKALALEPDTLAWRLIEARATAREGNNEKALLLLSGLDQSQAREPAILRLKAECFGALSRPADAAALYTTASDQQPANPDLAFEAAAWLERAGDKTTALVYARRAASLGHALAGEVATRLAADAGQ